MSANPLLRRAVTRSLSGGPSAWLQLTALTLLAAAAAAAPVFGEAAANASMRTVLDGVPPTARAAEAPVVRLNGGVAPTEARQAAFIEALDGLPGANSPAVRAFSIGLEVAPPRSVVTSVVETASGGSQRARLAGVSDPASVLDVVAAEPVDGGVWLPEPVASELGVAPGDEVLLAVDRGQEPGVRVPALVAGVYRTGPDGRRPADVPGSSAWVELRGGLPRDTELSTLPAYLAVTDLAAATRLAREVDDQLLWSAQVELDPAYPTLDQARETVLAVDRLREDVLVPSLVDIDDGPLRLSVASGLDGLVERAEAMTRATETSTRVVGRAGVVLGLCAVVAAGVLTVRRRVGEVRAATGVGVPARALAGLAVVEWALPAVVVALPLGTAAAVAAVVLGGPPGAVTAGGVLVGAVTAAVALAVALVCVALVTGATALAAARPARVGGARRPRPWVAALVLAAGAVAAGLATRPRASAGLGPVDLLAPLLLAAATTAVGAVLLGRLLRRLSRGRLLRPRRSRGRVSVRRAARWLALRRAAAPGDERAVVVTLVGTGLSVLLFAAASVSSVADVVEDRVAVRVGAEATAEVDGSWTLDPDAPARVVETEEVVVTSVRDLPPGIRVPPVPAGQTVVWRSTSSLPGLDGAVDVLVVDPESFADAASWGPTGALDGLRDLLPRMAALDAEAAAALRAGRTEVRVPAVVVGDLDVVRPGQVASIDVEVVSPLAVEVLDVVPAAPVRLANRAVVVVPADSYLLQLLNRDPRLAPAGRPQLPPSRFRTELWSATGAADLARTLEVAGVEELPELGSAADERGRPAYVAAGFAGTYQLALGGVLALLSVLALALYADRATSSNRASDVLLARAGLGRAGVARARAAELLVMGCAATALAVLGTLASTPLASRLLEPDDGSPPAARLSVEPVHLAVLLVAGALVVGVAVATAWARAASSSDAEVLRDA